MTRLSLLGLLAVACLSTAARAEDNWPRFRGPNADGVATDHAGLPTTWTTTENVKWVADVPGWGWSCPIVWGDRVFLTTVVSDEKNLTPSKGLYLGQGVRDPAKGIHHWMVYCFDLNTGKELWKREAHTGSPQLEGIYKSIGDLVGIELDLARIRQTRSKVAKRLREQAAKHTSKDSGAAVPPGPSTSTKRFRGAFR